MAREEINYPRCEFKVANLKAAVWANNKVDQNGKSYVQKTINLQKSYKDPATGNWVNKGITVFPNEILALLIVTFKAAEHCLLVEPTEGPQQPTASQ